MYIQACSQEFLRAGEVPLENKIDTKYMQVNILRNIASMI